MGHTIEVRGDTVWVILEGRVTYEEVKSVLDALLSHPEFRPGMPCLWDARGASGASLSSDELDRFAGAVAERLGERGEGRTALVVPRDVDYGAGRTYQQKFERGVAAHFRPFRDVEQAEAWLRTPLDQAEPNDTST